MRLRWSGGPGAKRTWTYGHTEHREDFSHRLSIVLPTPPSGLPRPTHRRHHFPLRSYTNKNIHTSCKVYKHLHLYLYLKKYRIAIFHANNFPFNYLITSMSSRKNFQRNFLMYQCAFVSLTLFTNCGFWVVFTCIYWTDDVTNGST